MIRSDHLTNVLLAAIAVLLAYIAFQPATLRLLARSEPAPRFAERTFGEWKAYLRDLSPGVRQRAVEALRHFGPSAVPVLAETAGNDTSLDVRMAAAAALGAMGSEAQHALPQLIAAARGPEPRLRAIAISALAKVGVQASEAVPPVIEAANDADPGVQLTAVQAIGELGPAAGEAVPALVAALESSQPRVRAAAAAALGRSAVISARSCRL